MTSSKEDYLKAIYEEGGLETVVPNKTISKKLGTAPPSVTEMLIKLSKQGLIIYQPYKGSLLTQKGFWSCLEIIRSHRLWEVFLIRHLGYSWREAHEDAHLLEHIVSPRLTERLEHFLGSPKNCPHGALIPQKGKIPAYIKPLRLSDLNARDSAFICRVAENGPLLDYLQRSGLQLLETLEIVSIDDYEGPVTFMQNGRQISISFKAATQIYVRHLHTESDQEDDQ